MTPVSIVKIVVSTSVLVAACGAALVFGVNREERLETGSIAVTASASKPQPSIQNEGPPAPAATETKVAALTAELAGQLGVPAADQSAPSFDLARVEGAGDAVIAGRAAPGAIVDLLRGGERLDRAVADASGEFVMVPPRLPAGSYELTLSARLPDGTVTSSRQGVTVTVKNSAAGLGAAQPRAAYVSEGPPQAPPSVQPPLQAETPQQSAALKPAQVNTGNSTLEESVSSPAVAPRRLTKVVSRGDSLWRISRITYGDGARYAIVYRANRDHIRDPNLIHPGQVIVLPMRPH